MLPIPKREHYLRDRLITRDEINKITEKSPLREKAFFTLMRQSGLPPHTIKQLKIGNLEKVLEPYTPIPCKITLPHGKTPAFIGHETLNYLKRYLLERTNPQQESLLFTIRNKPNKEINTKDVSRTFKRAAKSLKSPNGIVSENKTRKPNELKLYSLIRFYRENAKRYLTELNKTTTLQSDAFYRKLYAREAMPNLEIELPTPIQMHQLKDRLATIERTVQETYTPVRRLYYEIVGLIPEDKDMLFEKLKPDIPEKNEEDREQRIQKTLHGLVERIKEEDKKALAKMKTNHHDVPLRRASEKSLRKADQNKRR
jgi:hypothetical protein